MTGLTGSRKTTVLNKIHTEGVLTEILTSGFSVEMLSHPYTSIATFDVGGENIIPLLYMQHFRSMKSLIFVVDRNDRNRVLEASDELHRMLNEVLHMLILICASEVMQSTVQFEGCLVGMGNEDEAEWMKLRLLESFNNRLRQAIATLEESVFDSKSPYVFSGEEIESNSHEDVVGTSEEYIESKYLEECPIGKNKVVMCAGEGNQASTDSGLEVLVRVLMPLKNFMIKEKVLRLREEYQMFLCGFKVQSMLAKLGYAPGQCNLNFWIILDRVYIAWWLAKLGEPTFEQFMHLYSVSRKNGKFGWVQTNCIEAKKIGYFVGRMPSSQKTWKKK
ncbi:hypothetical protein L3X38_018816 [Prunus dulcis]|uniref:Uncharacterized protein n=1 Tax=Prunus dulcis TaxID=3755 RepID=A0AAD4WBH1_PRUDU|nr:hypothetical protein L3X38_018816 [Prunus dulcis]